MQRSEEIRVQLNAIAAASDFDEASQQLVDHWVERNVGFEAVEPILRFMEEHQAIDYGSPGDLAHFVERFWKKGYEDALVASIKRRPTGHTTWLLNRLINGQQRPPAQPRSVPALVRQRVAEFGVRNERKGQMAANRSGKAATRRVWSQSQSQDIESATV